MAQKTSKKGYWQKCHLQLVKRRSQEKRCPVTQGDLQKLEDYADRLSVG